MQGGKYRSKILTIGWRTNLKKGEKKRAMLLELLAIIMHYYFRFKSVF